MVWFKRIACAAVTAAALFPMASCMLLDAEDVISGQGQKVGVVEINGIITDSKEILKQIEEFRDDKSVKAVVVRIDSGGGAVGAVQEIYREVMRLRDKKKVAASMGNTAASGGYYIAAAADRIYTNPGTVTGSIGVIMNVVDVEDFLEMLKVRVATVKSGRYKDSGSPFRAVSPEERQVLQDVVSEVHRQFIADIAKGRNRSQSEVEPWADGRIITGAKAIEAGLADEAGDIYDASAWCAKAAGITGKPVMVYGKKRASLFKNLINGFFGDVEEAAWGKLGSGLFYR